MIDTVTTQTKKFMTKCLFQRKQMGSEEEKDGKKTRKGTQEQNGGGGELQEENCKTDVSTGKKRK
ncbi:hypothetical protein A6R68_02097, partial [Neotoma lepida]